MTPQEEYRDTERYIRSRSKKVIPYKNGIRYCCLYHDDKAESAFLTLENEKVLHYCHVCGSIYHRCKKDAGLWTDYQSPQQTAKRVSKKQYWLEKYSQARYDLYNINTGEQTHTKYKILDREGKKQFPQGHYDENNTWIDGLDGIDTSLSVFCNGRIKQLQQAIKQGTLICYAEGEKDTLTLWKYGYIAFTCGAVRTFKQAILPYLKGANVIVFGDNDNSGRADANRIAGLINTVGRARVIIPPEVPEKGDITDYMSNHSKEDLQKLIAENTAVTDITVPTGTTVRSSSVPKGTPLVNQLVKLDAAKRFATNDKGSAELFSTVFKNVSRYNPTQKDWMYYNGIKWIADTEGMKAKRNAKKLADAILSYAVNVSELDRENYLKYASRLMNYRDRNTMVNDAKDLNFFENTELDKDDLLLNLKNCVLDLSGDMPKVLEHNADLLLSKCCNASYDPQATCKLWEKTINEIMEGNEEKIRYLQKILGLCLTGITAEEELYFFYGASTRNGKSTICETVLSILNDYGATISPETLAVKANKDSRTASPDIAKLAGTRLVIASEPPKKMIFDTSLVKTLTGRDRVTARFLHQNEFFFTPKFKLLINTNYLPTITDQTVFKSGRIRVVSFNKHFGEHEQNKKLKDELRKEANGILNWMIRGLYLYRKEGLEPPTAVRDSTNEYEADSDKIGRFISECLVKSDKNTSAKDVYETYSKWCSDSGLGVDGRNNFYIELKTRGLFGASGTVNGKTVRNIVRGYVLANEEFMSVDENEPLPFD